MWKPLHTGHKQRHSPPGQRRKPTEMGTRACLLQTVNTSREESGRVSWTLPLTTKQNQSVPGCYWQHTPLPTSPSQISPQHSRQIGTIHSNSEVSNDARTRECEIGHGDWVSFDKKLSNWGEFPLWIEHLALQLNNDIIITRHQQSYIYEWVGLNSSTGYIQYTWERR